MASPLTIQPAAAAGKDAKIDSNAPTAAAGTSTNITVGDSSATVSQAVRGLIAFDVSGIPAGSLITAVTLSLWEYGAGSAGGGPASWAAELHRVLHDWVEAEATWNTYSTAGGNWATAGCGNATDRSDTVSASLTLDGIAAAAFVSWSGDGLVADVQAWLDGAAANYGWLIAAPAAELLGTTPLAYGAFRSSDYTVDATQCPKLVVAYTEAGGGTVPVNLLRTHILAQGVV